MKHSVPLTILADEFTPCFTGSRTLFKLHFVTSLVYCVPRLHFSAKER
jgi:hypothetical protein